MNQFLLSLMNSGLNGIGTGVFLLGASQVYSGKHLEGVILLVAGLLVLAGYEYTPVKVNPTIPTI